MAKRLKFKKLFHSSIPNNLSVPKYTRDIWIKVASEQVSRSDAAKSWDDKIVIHSLDTVEFARIFISECLKDYKVKEHDTARIIILDEEFEAWCNEKEVKVSDIKAQAEYCNSLSDSEAMRLFVKNKADVITTGAYYPIMLFSACPLPRSTELTPSQEVLDFAKTAILEKCSDGVDAFCLPYYVDYANILKYKNDMLNIAETYFDFHQRVRFEILSSQEKWNGANIEHVFIPVFTRYKLDSCIIRCDDYALAENDNAMYERDPSRNKIDGAWAEGNDSWKKFVNDVSNDIRIADVVSPCPGFIHDADVKKYVEEFAASFLKDAKKNQIEVKLNPVS